jgi:hypothetical protein
MFIREIWCAGVNRVLTGSGLGALAELRFQTTEAFLDSFLKKDCT